MKKKNRHSGEKQNDTRISDERREFLSRVAKTTAYSFPLIYMSKIDSVFAQTKSVNTDISKPQLSTKTPTSPPKVDLRKEIEPIPQKRPGPVSQEYVAPTKDGTDKASCSCGINCGCAATGENAAVAYGDVTAEYSAL